MDILSFLQLYGSDFLVIAIMLLCKFFGNPKTDIQLEALKEKKIAKLKAKISKENIQAEKDIIALEELTKKEE